MWWKWIVILLGLSVISAACAEGTSEDNDGEPGPRINIEGGDALSWDLSIGQSAQASFSIENSGIQPLNFDISHDADWLRVEPTSGEVAPDLSQEVVASAGCDDQSGERAVTVQIDHDDPTSSAVGLSAVLICRDDGEENDEEDENTTQPVGETGELQIFVDGLPPGVDAAISLDGPQGFSEEVTDSTVFGNLATGTISVEAQPVGSDQVYEPQPAQTTVEIVAGERAEVAISYELVSGSIQVNVDGLPTGVEPDLTVVGQGSDWQVPPDGFVDQLEPGTYTVVSPDVDTTDGLYRASDPEVVVFSGQTTSVTVSYHANPGSLQVSVEQFGNPVFVVMMEGPDGFSTPISNTQILDAVPPGTYSFTVSQKPVDAYGNEGWVIIEPDGEVEIQAGQIANVFIEAGQATVVARSTGDDVGSLPWILDQSLSWASAISFHHTVDEVVLTDGPIEVDGVLELVGDDEASVTLRADGDRLFDVTSSGLLILDGLTLKDGYVEDSGGAVYLDEGAALYARRTVFEDNHAVENGGAIYVASGVDLFLREAVFRLNFAENNGGAIATPASIGNEARIDVEASLFEFNDAGNDGGALYLANDTAIFESTFIDNLAEGRGGAIRVWAGDVEIYGATITENLAEQGGGISYFGDTLMSLTLGRSIVAGNLAVDGGTDLERTLSSRDLESLGYNLVGVEGAGFEGGQNGDEAGTETSPLEPHLGPMIDNGGFSETMAPTATSPARASVPAGACEQMRPGALPVRDQRRKRRPAGATCNRGAVELDASHETFSNADMSEFVYEDGVFSGDDGQQWTYEETRRSGFQSGTIEGTSLVLRHDPAGSIRAEGIGGGISSFSVQLAHAFTGQGDRQVELLINGNTVATSEPFDDGDIDGVNGGGEIRRFAVDDIGVSGTFDLEIRSVGSGQVLVDNISWR